MGIRMDQPMGLNDWANALVNKCKMVRHVSFNFGEGLRFSKMPVMLVKAEESGDFYYGMCEQAYPLMKYTLPDGRIFREYLQVQPWSSGPMSFLALMDGNGKPVLESLWTEEEIDRATG